MQAAKTKVVFVAFETLKRPVGVDEFVRVGRMGLQALGKEVGKHLGAPVGGQSKWLFSSLVLGFIMVGGRGG